MSDNHTEIEKKIQDFVDSGKANVLVKNISVISCGKGLMAQFDMSLVDGGRKMATSIYGIHEQQLLHKTFGFLSD